MSRTHRISVLPEDFHAVFVRNSTSLFLKSTGPIHKGHHFTCKVLVQNINLVRLEGGRENKVIGVLINSCDENGATLTDRQVEDTILNLMIASYDTTATACTQLLQDLQKHPQVHAVSLHPTVGLS